MSEQEPKARPDEKTLGWVSVGIGTITIAATVAATQAIRNHALWLRLIVSIAIGCAVFLISWVVARLCGVGPCGGIDGVRRDPATGRRLPSDETSR